MANTAKKQRVHSELRKIFNASDTFDGWVAGMDKLCNDFNLNINLHEMTLVCGKDLKGNVYEYCKKVVNNALL